MPKIEHQADGSLTLREDARLARSIFFAMAIALAVGVIEAFTHTPLDMPKILSWSFTSLVGFVAVALLETTFFVFDVAQREVRWTRRQLWRTRTGQAPFADISNVVLQRRGDTEGESYRVALITSTGVVPLSRDHSSNQREQEHIALAISAVVHSATDRASLIERSIAQLAAAGEVIDAVALAKTEYHLSTTEAKQFVDKMKQRQ